MPGAIRSRGWLRAAILLGLPLAVAVVVLAGRRWYPVLDLAQTELRLRDVPTRHAPLIGLPGRIGKFLQGSHPGPLSFYALWPLYRAGGGSGWSMQLAAAGLNAGAAALALWLVHRRGGPALLWSFAAGLALLMRFYGPSYLTQPWNPYLPMLWFVVFLVAVWALSCGDWVGLPIAVAAGSFCVQTHISYAALVAGLGACGLAFALHRAVRAADPGTRRRWWRALGAGTALGAVLWLPPVLQQVTGDHGNLAIVWRYFTNPPQDSIGIRAGVEQILVHLNPWSVLARRNVTAGSLLPGVAVLAAWVGSVVVAVRAGEARLLRFHLLLGVALVLGALSISRIFGFLWYYLMLWAWGLAVLVYWSIGWGAWVAWRTRTDGGNRERVATGAAMASAGLALVVVAAFALDARRVDVPEPPLSNLMAALVPDLLDALEDGRVPGGGRDGRYLVTYVDTVNIGAAQYGLVNELERAGFRAGGPPVLRWVVTPHRVLTPATATATVHFSRGLDIPRARRRPGFVRVAAYEPRRPAEVRRYRALRHEAIRRLRAAGRDDLVPLVDRNLFIATFDPRLDPGTKRLLEEMLDLGQPAAVFVGPPTLALMTR